MSAKDIYHDNMKEALISDGWVVTDDPYTLSVGDVHFRIDLGAEKLIIAEKQGLKIAVEIKSFTHPSPVKALHEAIGQYETYSLALDMEKSERKLYLAIPKRVHDDFFQRQFVQELIKRKKLALIICDVDKKEIARWIN